MPRDFQPLEVTKDKVARIRVKNIICCVSQQKGRLKVTKELVSGEKAPPEALELPLGLFKRVCRTGAAMIETHHKRREEMVRPHRRAGGDLLCDQAIARIARGVKELEREELAKKPIVNPAPLTLPFTPEELAAIRRPTKKAVLRAVGALEWEPNFRGLTSEELERKLGPGALKVADELVKEGRILSHIIRGRRWYYPHERSGERQKYRKRKR